jgi:hypothetical protein
MNHRSLDAFLQTGRATLTKGPLAVIMAEDQVEVDTTIRHHLDHGFAQVILLADDRIRLPEAIAARIQRVTFDTSGENALVFAVNRLIPQVSGLWVYYGYNAEYLFYPFCETRSVREMLAFHTEERRDAMLTYVVDLYADNLDRFPNAVSIETANLDRSGYYALARPDPTNHNHSRERQLDFFGGLRWRFEEHVPSARRKIDRIALFRAKPGLELRPDFTLTDEEYNTFACPWHNNITSVIASFRAAKALRTNSGSMFDIKSFHWHNSLPFQWHSQQLMDLGLMEPGQWF